MFNTFPPTGRDGWAMPSACKGKAPAFVSSPFARFQIQKASPNEPEMPAHRQWPYRGFAFASDLGLVGYLLRQPVLGTVGWLIALPYYAYALFQQKDSQGRKEEGVYQITANGIFPFIEAKVGVSGGAFAYRKLSQTAGTDLSTIRNRLTLPICKGVGGLAALLTLTPTVGDPLSHWLLSRYQSRINPNG